MSYVEYQDVAVTTAAGGGATVYSTVVRGRIQQVQYIKTDFADGVDFAITTEVTAQNIWTETNVNAAKVVNPVTAADLESGTASTLTELGIYAAAERVKIVIVAGGNTKTGSFRLIVT